MRIMAQITFALVFILSPVSSYADDYVVGSLLIEHPWLRATPKGASVAAGYLVIENKGSASDRLVSGSSAIADRIEIHEMKMDSGVMKMRPLSQGLEIAPGKSVKLAPGGYHLMFVALKQMPIEGKRFKATLVFEKAGPVEVEFMVEGMGSAGGEHKH